MTWFYSQIYTHNMMKKRNLSIHFVACSFLLFVFYKVCLPLQTFFPSSSCFVVVASNPFFSRIELKKEIVAWFNDLIALCNVIVVVVVVVYILPSSFTFLSQSVVEFYVAMLAWIDVKSFFHYISLYAYTNVDQCSIVFTLVSNEHAQQLWCALMYTQEIFPSK